MPQEGGHLGKIGAGIGAVQCEAPSAQRAADSPAPEGRRPRQRLVESNWSGMDHGEPKTNHGCKHLAPVEAFIATAEPEPGPHR
jgi:hypothetical protein